MAQVIWVPSFVRSPASLPCVVDHVRFMLDGNFFVFFITALCRWILQACCRSLGVRSTASTQTDLSDSGITYLPCVIAIADVPLLVEFTAALSGPRDCNGIFEIIEDSEDPLDFFELILDDEVQSAYSNHPMLSIDKTAVFQADFEIIADEMQAAYSNHTMPSTVSAEPLVLLHSIGCHPSEVSSTVARPLRCSGVVRAPLSFSTNVKFTTPRCHASLACCSRAHFDASVLNDIDAALLDLEASSGGLAAPGTVVKAPPQRVPIVQYTSLPAADVVKAPLRSVTNVQYTSSLAGVVVQAPPRGETIVQYTSSLAADVAKAPPHSVPKVLYTSSLDTDGVKAPPHGEAKVQYTSSLAADVVKAPPPRVANVQYTSTLAADGMMAPPPGVPIVQYTSTLAAAGVLAPPRSENIVQYTSTLPAVSVQAAPSSPAKRKQSKWSLYHSKPSRFVAMKGSPCEQPVNVPSLVSFASIMQPVAAGTAVAAHFDSTPLLPVSTTGLVSAKSSACCEHSLPASRVGAHVLPVSTTGSSCEKVVCKGNPTNMPKSKQQRKAKAAWTPNCGRKPYTPADWSAWEAHGDTIVWS